MRILFDHQIFGMQRHGGISRYITALAQGLARLPEVHPIVVAPLHLNAHLCELPASIVRGGYHPWRLAGLPAFERLVRAPLAARHYRALGTVDVVHETYYTATPRGRGRARVVTVYDMIHERFPEVSAGENQRTVSHDKRAAVRRADHLICISEATRADLCRLFEVDEARTSVVHLGVAAPPVASQMARPSGLGTTDRPVLLFVGPRTGYKNFRGLLAAVAGAPRLRHAVDIVAIGGDPLTREERHEIAAFGLTDQVRQEDGDDRSLAIWYRRAAALVYPSLAEGFGLPPLEAMAHGCPVICGAVGALPEVVGDAGLIIDPTRPEAIADAIERLLASDPLRATCFERGGARAAHYTWERCVAETLAIYRRFA